MPIYCLAALGKIFYHLDDFDQCQAVFRLMLHRNGPCEAAYYYLAACSEIKNDFRESLALYTKALRLENCEDTRTGICRVSAKLRERSEKVLQA